MTSVDLNIELSEGMTEMLSKILIESYPTSFLRLLIPLSFLVRRRGQSPPPLPLMAEMAETATRAQV